MVVDIRPQTQLLTDDARHHSWDELMQLKLKEKTQTSVSMILLRETTFVCTTHIFLQIQGGVVHQRFDHPHQINQKSQVVLHHINPNLRGGEKQGRTFRLN